MILQSSDYILGYWFADDKQGNCWYMLIIKRNDEWLIQYTFRYNRDKEYEFNPFSGKDKKNVYNGSRCGAMPESEVIDATNTLFELIKLKYNNYSDWFLVQGDIGQFIKISKTKSYLHMKAENIH